MSELLPKVITETPDYDPSNPYHYRKWDLAGKPDVDALDSDGQKWKPTIQMILQDDGQTYLPRELPGATPLTDVEIAIRGAAENFEKARLAAPKALDRLKGTIHTALVSGGMSSGEATAAGVGLVLLHGPLLAAFEAAGGHPVAGKALYAAIASQESVAALPWLTAPILAIFAAALAPG